MVSFSIKRGRVYWYKGKTRISQSEARSLLPVNCINEWFQRANIWVRVDRSLDYESIAKIKLSPLVRLKGKKKGILFHKTFDQAIGIKPDGVWFSQGSWLWDPYREKEEKTIEEAMEEVSTPVVIVKTPRVKVVSTDEEFLAFHATYSVAPSEERILFWKEKGARLDISLIDWPRVARDCPGIAFTKKVFCGGKYMWHTTFDVESLVVWDISVVKDTWAVVFV